MDADCVWLIILRNSVPAIFLYSLKDSGVFEFSRTINLPGNPFELGVEDDKKLIVAVDPSGKEAGEYDVKKSLLRVEYVDGEYRVSEDVIKDAESLDAEVFLNDDVPAEEFERMLYSAETLRKVYFDEKGDEEEIKDELMNEDGLDIKNEGKIKDDTEL